MLKNIDESKKKKKQTSTLTHHLHAEALECIFDFQITVYRQPGFSPQTVSPGEAQTDSQVCGSLNVKLCWQLVSISASTWVTRSTYESILLLCSFIITRHKAFCVFLGEKDVVKLQWNDHVMIMSLSVLLSVQTTKICEIQ